MENVFIEGLRVYKPSEKAPEFIVANLEFDVTVLNAFLEQHPNEVGKVRGVIKKSKEGKYYAALDTYKAAPKVEAADDVAGSIPF